MQTERLLALACWLEGGAKHKLHIHGRDVVFDMSKGIEVLAEVGQDFDPNTCNTACCIAGAAVEFFAPDEANGMLKQVHRNANHAIKDPGYMHPSVWRYAMQVDFFDADATVAVQPLAQELLGLDDDQATQLFVPTMYDDFENLGHMELRDFTDPAWAARTIRYGVEHGVFDWEATQ